MTLVVAQGTFDLIHTGHIHYLENAATYGDELAVIVARQANVTHKPAPILAARQRRDIIDALHVVDRAILGDETDIFAPIERLDPDVIVLGHDQHHDETAISDELARRAIDCEVVRASHREQRFPDELLSTSDIIDRILERRG